MLYPYGKMQVYAICSIGSPIHWLVQRELSILGVNGIPED